MKNSTPRMPKPVRIYRMEPSHRHRGDLSLVEQGKIALQDQYPNNIPEFANSPSMAATAAY